MSIQFCLYPTTMFTPAAGPELAMSASCLQVALFLFLVAASPYHVFREVFVSFLTLLKLIRKAKNILQM